MKDLQVLARHQRMTLQELRDTRMQCRPHGRATMARWLLMARDRMESDTYPLTQEFAAMDDSRDCAKDAATPVSSNDPPLCNGVLLALPLQIPYVV
jgi:hypothetical protein